MTRKEVLEALEAKFEGVSASILGRIADRLVRTAKSDEDAATAVAGVTFQQVLESYGDSRATEAQQSAVSNYEKKYGLREGKPANDDAGAEPTKGTEPNTHNTPNKGKTEDPTLAALRELMAQNRSLSERLDKMDGERIAQSRRQRLSEVTAKLPASVRKAYDRTQVEGLDDKQFEALVGEISTEVGEIVKSTQARGAVFGRPGTQGGKSDGADALSKEQLDAISRRGSAPAEGQPF